MSAQPILTTPAATSHAAEMPFGAWLMPEGGVCFRLWAPEAQRIELVEWRAERKALHTADCQARGWYECRLAHAGSGTLYQWRVDSDLLVPDPASRFNPDGPHGPSEVIDPRAFAWDTDWRGRPWADVVLYELHVGTFTPEGTYAAAELRLTELAATGITAIELLPLSTFPGRFGWGYDGVLPYAPFAGYGRPEELKHFIRAAHRLGLMVFLDVVYNHFGPDGNFLGAYAPQFFSKVHQNPWGNSLNFDREGSDTVRSFFVRNALYWLEEYRFDGLRLDAVHAIVDDSALDVIDELAYRIHERINDRHVHLVLENENNAAHRLPSGGRYDAQWNDDFHHAMHAALTGETAGYYGDYADQPVALVARALTHGFLWEGARRNGEGRRAQLRPAPAQTLNAMVNFLNNHDQAGNRAFGERLLTLLPEGAERIAFGLTLLSPATPLLFAGEEFGAQTPFLYFADWQDELRRAVTEGRLREFGHFAKRADGREDELPDPCEVATFKSCKLDWEAARSARGEAWRGFVRAALSARREWFTPRAAGLIAGGHVAHMVADRAFVLRWRYEGGQVLELECNLGPDAVAGGAANIAPWRPLAGAVEIFRVNEIGPTLWQPWSGRWTFGQEMLHDDQ